MNGGIISAVPHLPSSSMSLPSFAAVNPPQVQGSESSISSILPDADSQNQPQKAERKMEPTVAEAGTV